MWNFLYNEQTLNKKANEGDLECQLFIARKYLKDKNEEAIKYLEMAANQNNIESCESLGDIYFSKQENEKSEEKRKEYITQSVIYYHKAMMEEKKINNNNNNNNKLKTAKSYFQLANYK